MSSFEETLSRMKNLYTYGQEINESNNAKNYTLEYHAEAANGKSYGIIRECNKYYIKSAPAEKATIAEAYDYLGGFNNKKDYEYSSFALAQKQFELKMASINEACNGKVNVATLDPFRANAVLAEGTQKMHDEIARCRQIMYNASMLMNESIEIGADRKNDVVKYDGKNPESENGNKGCEGGECAKAEPEFDGKSTNGVDTSVKPFNEKTPKCPDQLSEGCDCEGGECNCGKEDWGSEGMGKGRDPKQVGWEMDGQQTVNEEDNEWASKGLPSEAGVGEADTEHNDDPFNKAVDECFEEGSCCNEDDEFSADDIDLADAESDPEARDKAEDDMKDEFGDKYIDMKEDDEEDLGADEKEPAVDGEEELDIDGEDEPAVDGEDSEEGFESDAEGDDDSDNDDIMSQIEELQAQIDALKARLEGGEEPSSDMEEPEIEDEPSSDDDIDVADDSEEDFSDDDFSDDDFDEEGEGDVDECPVNSGFHGTDEPYGYNGQNNPTNSEDVYNKMHSLTGDSIYEAKAAKMNSIVESVVKKILAEDELHDFGKHPGYRKKPMELPATGEDKNQWGEDWNDESAHNEQPFGEKIGDGDPFNKLVDAITKDVVSQLKEVKKK